MIPRAVRRVIWITLALCFALPVVAYFARPVPVVLQICLGLYGVLTLMRPFEALMLVAGLGPVAAVLASLSGSPYGGEGLAEVMVLLLLSGFSFRVAAGQENIEPAPFDWVLLIFALLAAASCLALLPVMRLRAAVHDELPLLGLLHNFFEAPMTFRPLFQALLLIEGAALAAITVRLAVPGRAALLAGSVVIGGIGAAAINVQRLFEISLRQPPFFDALFRLFYTTRISTQFGDLNAAGSYFAMITVMAFALSGWRSRRERLAAAGLPIVACALWLSGSRVAIAAAIVCSALLLAVKHGAGAIASRRRRLTLAGVTMVLLIGVVVAFFVYPAQGRARFGYSVFARVELFKTGLAMLADRPILGVGIAQFYELFPRYASPELREAFAHAASVPVTHENAHNNLMQILAELGIAGLLAFVAAVALAFRRPSGATSPSWCTGARLGLAAFLITALAGHPLLTRMVAYPFWLVLGLAASGAGSMPDAVVTWLRRAAISVGLVLLVTLPLRARHERSDAGLAGVSIGFSRWEQDAEGNQFRVAGERSTIFVDANSQFVRIPLRSPDDALRRVNLALDGRPAAGLLVQPGIWREARLLLPRGKDSPRFRRIDIVVEPPQDGHAASDRPRILVGPVWEAGQEHR